MPRDSQVAVSGRYNRVTLGSVEGEGNPVFCFKDPFGVEPMVKDQPKSKGRRLSLKSEKGRVRATTTKRTKPNRASKDDRVTCKRLEEALTESEKRYQTLLDYVGKSVSLIEDMEEEMTHALKMEQIGRIMVPTLVHDLGNLLGAIRSNAQFCLENLPLGASVNEIVQTIFETSEKANTLIKNFLTAARSAKFADLIYEPLDINALITHIWKTVRVQTPRHVSFEAEFDRNLPEIMGDIQKLERLFLNLLTNAIQAVPDHGKITVRTRYLSSEKMVEIDVLDNGPGVPEEIREKIFEPFFTTKKGGMGLGLSTCQFIVQQHKGSIGVDREANQGTKFSVKLPAFPDEAFLRPAPRFPNANGDDKKVTCQMPS